MNAATMIDAAVLYTNLAGELQHYLTRTAPDACSDVADAVAALRAGRPAMVRAEDRDAVIAEWKEGKE